MADIKINTERCKGCCLCVAECPRGVMRMSTEPNEQGHFYPVIDDAEKCTGCALCCQMCPDMVIEIEK
jgi:2-oxoglutarate ferredoxin oxidoreductase subunit delta